MTAEKPRMKKLKAGETIFNVVNHLVFGIFTLLCIYPFYYLIINSISANDLSANGMINFLPKQIHFQNYIEVMKLSGIKTAALVSVARTVIGTTCTVLASAYLGFMFTQQKMWKRKLFYRFFVVTMYFSAGLIPMFMTMKLLHLTNSFWVYIIPAIVNPFDIIMMKTYVESTPASLQEAAEVDGAGLMTVFWKILLPTCTPILATIAIIAYTRSRDSQYDEEALATINDLYMQANELITKWGVNNNNTATGYLLPAKCFAKNPSNGGLNDEGKKMNGDGDGVSNDWTRYGLIVSGPHHWTYRICFGHFPTTGSDPNAPEGFLITAHRKIGNKERVIVYGSGISEPIINATGIPSYATLTDAGTINLTIL